MGQALVIVAIAVPQVLVSLRPWPWLVRLLAALALFPLVEGLAAFVFGFTYGYWTR